MRRPMALALLIIAMTLGACGGGDTATTSPDLTTPGEATTTTTIPVSTTTISAVSTTGASTTTTGPEVDVYLEGGQVVGPDSFSFVVGDEASIWLLADIDDEVHVHGFDVSFQAKAGVPVEIALTVDVPGIFEVELESTHTPLFELVVNP